MLWELVNIQIKRQTDELDVNNEYIILDIYNIPWNVIEIKNSPFSINVSQAEEVQQYAFWIWIENINVMIWDIVYHNDWLWDIVSKVTERPKKIQFEEEESFIKLRTKFIWN